MISKANWQGAHIHAGMKHTAGHNPILLSLYLLWPSLFVLCVFLYVLVQMKSLVEWLILTDTAVILIFPLCSQSALSERVAKN